MEWGDLNLETCELTVRHNLVKNAAGQYGVGLPKADMGRRKLVLAPDIADILRDHWCEEHRGRRAPRPEDFVFTVALGNHVQPRHLDRTYRTLMEQGGLPCVRFHGLRHNAASLRRRVSAKAVADPLWDADATFTLKVYTSI